MAGAGARIVDAHVHMIDASNGLDYLWAQPPASLSPPRRCPCAPPCLCNWTQPQYAAASAALKVTDIVFCEVDVNTTQWLREARWVTRMAATLKAGPRISAILAQPPPGLGTAPVAAIAAQLDALTSLPLVKGVRPDIKPPLSGHFHGAMRELGRRGLVVDINFGFGSPGALGNLTQLVSQAPNTSFVIEHLWGAPGIGSAASAAELDGWTAGLAALAKHSNIKCLQVGGVMAGWGHSAPYAVNRTVVKQRISSAIDLFTYERVCFEGNWFFNNWGPPHPDVEVYQQWVAIVKEALSEKGATEAERALFFGGAAAKAYGLRTADEA